MTIQAQTERGPRNGSQGLSFDDNSVAEGYDRVLAPLLFEPWAARLLRDVAPWKGRHVLDLATGTGVVARMLAEEVGPTGRVLGVDINETMLAQARKRCAHPSPVVSFLESPAQPLAVEDESVDVVVCQQGFQFFPDKHAAAREIHRVLRDGGQVVVTTWRSASECRIFGAICEALDAIEQPTIADAMRVPFDFMPAAELVAPFRAAGFRNVRARRLERDLVLPGGVAQAVEVAYASPIGPRLRALPKNAQSRFRSIFERLVVVLGNDTTTMGIMAANELRAEKATRPRRAGTHPSA